MPQLVVLNGFTLKVYMPWLSSHNHVQLNKLRYDKIMINFKIRALHIQNIGVTHSSVKGGVKENDKLQKLSS